MSLGALTVRLGLDAAEFTGGLSKSEYQARKFVENTTASIKNLSLLFVGVGVAAAGALEVMNRAANTVAVYKGLSEQMGATASAVASLQMAADVSGVAIDTIGKASVRLTANLSKAGQMSKDTASALAAINIPIEEFRNLDPVTQLERVALQMAKFEDGAGKTAVAVQLFGRAGAELIPFFNDLAAAGGRQLRLTDEQIEAADKYTKQIAGLKSELQALSQGIIADVLPTFSKLLERMNQIRATSVAGWLTTSGSQEKDAGAEIKRITESLEKLRKTREELDPKKGFANKLNDVIFGDVGDLDKQISLLEKQREYLKQIQASQALSNGVPDERRFQADPKAALKFQLKDDAKSSTPKISDAERYLKSLERTYEATQQLTHYEQLMWDVQQGRLGAVTPKQLEYAVSLTKSLDAQKAANIEAEKEAALRELISKSLDRDAAAQERANQQLQSQASAWLDLADPMRKFIRDLEEIDGLVSKGMLTADQAKMIRQNMGDRTEKGTDELDQYAINAARSMQSAFADFLFDPFKDGLDGMLANFGKIIQRMIAEAAAAQLMKYLFGDFAKTGSLGGVVGAFAGGFGGGGSMPEGAPFATGTNYVPYDGMQATLHKGEAVVPAKYNPAAGGMGGGTTIVQHINFNGSQGGSIDPARIARMVGDVAVAKVAEAQARGG